MNTQSINQPIIQSSLTQVENQPVQVVGRPLENRKTYVKSSAVMSCHVVACQVMSCHVTSRHVMSCVYVRVRIGACSWRACVRGCVCARSCTPFRACALALLRAILRVRAAALAEGLINDLID